MDYSKQYFGKELNELTYQDIENFFVDEKDESDKIEFKSYANSEDRNHTEKENGVIRAICGLLNSEGGLVIWGAPVGQTVTGKKEKIFKGALSPVDIVVEKDKFISRVTDLITPSPKGVRFQELSNAGKYLYIIEVDQSSYSPHQFRNVYYMRIDGQTKPAPHHYIEALFRKVTFPKIEGYIKIESVVPARDGIRMEITNMIFNKSKLQNEHDIYYRVVISAGTFELHTTYRGSDRSYELGGHELRVLNAKSTLYYDEPLTNTEYVHLRISDLLKTNYECDVFFYFGGKQSPLMISQYTIKLNDINIKDTNTLFTSIKENLYTHENSDQIGTPEAEKMKFFLGR